jgi:hypothetical protein
MSLGNLTWSVALHNVVPVIASLAVLLNFYLPIGVWIRRWLLDGVKKGAQRASHLKHLVGRF